MAEVYAGFLAHADDQIGRLLGLPRGDRRSARTPSSIVVSDNGASGEGGPNGSVNEMKFANGIPDDLDDEPRRCSTSSAARRRTTTTRTAGRWRSTRRSRCGSATSSTAAPATRASSRGPPGIEARGEIREQYHHAIDLVPTILDCLGVEPPETIKGHTQSRFDGVSMRYSFDDATVADRRARPSSIRCSARAASGTTAGRPSPPTRRSAAGATSTTTSGSCTTPRSTAPSSTTSPPSTRTRSRELVDLWFAEAGANSAFPLDDRSRARDHHSPRGPLLVAAAQPLRLLPRRRRGARVAGGQHPQPLLLDRRARRHPRARRRRACCSPTARAFGGHALYVKDNRLHYVYNFVGMIEQKIVATEDLPTGENLILSASFDKDGEDPPGVATGMLSLYHGDSKVGEGRIKTQPGKFMHRRRGAVHRPRQRRPGHRRLPGRAAVARSPAARSTASPSTSAASRTSTSSARPRPCSRASERKRR